MSGIWSSAFAANLDEIWEEVVVSKVGFLETLRDAIKVAGKGEICWAVLKVVWKQGTLFYNQLRLKAKAD